MDTFSAKEAPNKSKSEPPFCLIITLYNPHYNRGLRRTKSDVKNVLKKPCVEFFFQILEKGNMKKSEVFQLAQQQMRNGFFFWCCQGHFLTHVVSLVSPKISLFKGKLGHLQVRNSSIIGPCRLG